MNPFTNNPGPAFAPQFTIAYERNTPEPEIPVAIEVAIKAPAQQLPRAARRPLNISLVIDRSGSMAGPKLAAATQATLRLIDALADGERLAVVAFDDKVLDVCRSTVLDDAAREDIRRRILSLSSGGCTALFDGFLRGAQLVAEGGSAANADSWVIVLSDGMGNRGLTDPAQMKARAAALAERGIRTITIGIGESYQAAQLTALSNGGDGEFHHASNPAEICEIVLGELKALRTATVRDLSLSLTVHGMTRWLLLGGHAEQDGTHGATRFDRVDAERTVRVVVLGWPATGTPEIEVSASWLDEQQQPGSITLRATPEQAPAERDVTVARRAADHWHSHITTTALEVNERHEYTEAIRFVRESIDQFSAYVAGLPGMDDLRHSLVRLLSRIGRKWETAGHKEAYVRAQKSLRGKADYRRDAPHSLGDAMERDGPF